jgi:hypothetical protein
LRDKLGTKKLSVTQYFLDIIELTSVIGGIWPLIEFPALQQQFAAGLVTTCIAVPYDPAGYPYAATNNKANWRYVSLVAGAKPS